jgi:hypothetical protein
MTEIKCLKCGNNRWSAESHEGKPDISLTCCNYNIRAVIRVYVK